MRQQAIEVKSDMFTKHPNIYFRWHALKIAHRAPPQFRGELKQSIRQEMEKNSECKDKQKIRYLISEGLERIKQLDEMLDMQGH
uniref:Complex 1 LYR protein domain-containing protein n=1 Tax=Brassica campestris TaxID=3711 RepID=M4EWC4_BRACM